MRVAPERRDVEVRCGGCMYVCVCVLCASYTSSLVEDEKWPTSVKDGIRIPCVGLM